MTPIEIDQPADLPNDYKLTDRDFEPIRDIRAQFTEIMAKLESGSFDLQAVREWLQFAWDTVEMTADQNTILYEESASLYAENQRLLAILTPSKDQADIEAELDQLLSDLLAGRP